MHPALIVLCCVSLALCSTWSYNITHPENVSDSAFGYVVGVSGDWAVITAPYANNVNGAGYMYQRADRREFEFDYHSDLDISDTSTYRFGHTAAIDGDWVAMDCMQKCGYSPYSRINLYNWQ
ncbi:hypothetical protein KIPB_003587, partial [Kipferlia bialata]|eukprot:g3587.t1